MWLIIRKSDNAVVGTQDGVEPIGWNMALFEVKEWVGPEPPVHDSSRGVVSYDPTLTDPDYTAFSAGRGVLDEVEERATQEIAWLDDTIANIDTMDLEQLRDVLTRICQENRRVIGALRYVVRRL